MGKGKGKGGKSKRKPGSKKAGKGDKKKKGADKKGKGKKKRKRVDTDKERKVRLALESCWLEVEFGAHPSGFQDPASQWLLGPDTFSSVFPDMIDEYDRTRGWLLARSRELGILCRMQAGDGNSITLQNAEHAVREIKARYCARGRIRVLGGWCNFDVQP
jgi:hypothetical protein